MEKIVTDLTSVQWVWSRIQQPVSLEWHKDWKQGSTASWTQSKGNNIHPSEPLKVTLINTQWLWESKLFICSCIKSVNMTVKNVKLKCSSLNLSTSQTSSQFKHYICKYKGRILTKHHHIWHRISLFNLFGLKCLNVLHPIHIMIWGRWKV